MAAAPRRPGTARAGRPADSPNPGGDPRNRLVPSSRPRSGPLLWRSRGAPSRLTRAPRSHRSEREAPRWTRPRSSGRAATLPAPRTDSLRVWPPPLGQTPEADDEGRLPRVHDVEARIPHSCLVECPRQCPARVLRPVDTHNDSLHHRTPREPVFATCTTRATIPPEATLRPGSNVPITVSLCCDLVAYSPRRTRCSS